jgi:hypothetical protein
MVCWLWAFLLGPKLYIDCIGIKFQIGFSRTINERVYRVWCITLLSTIFQLYHGINGNVIVVDMKYPYAIYIPACKHGDHGLSGE